MTFRTADLEVMKAVAPQIGARAPGNDTRQAWAATIGQALGRMPGFGEAACAACGRDLPRGLAFCAYCGHDFSAPAEPRLPPRRKLVRLALDQGISPATLSGVTDAELAARVGLQVPSEPNL